MAHVVVKGMEITGVRSFVGTSFLPFPEHPGLVFLTGENALEPDLGANGAGKSSLWDALCCCFYGVGVRGRRLNSLLSWGKRTLSVAVVLEVDGREYVVERTGPPNAVFINGQPAGQAEVDGLLRLSRERFLHSVLFGQAVRLFPDLSVPERGALLDDVLDLSLWLTAAEVAQLQVRAIGGDRHKASEQLAYLNGQRDGLPSIRELNAQSKAWEQQETEKRAALVAEFEALKTAMADYKSQRDVAKEALSAIEKPMPVDELNQRRSEIDSRCGAMQVEWRNAGKEAAFYRENSTCPTCQQPIAAKLAKDKGEKASRACDFIEVELEALTKERKKLDKARADIEAENRRRSEHAQVLRLKAREAEVNERNAQKQLADVGRRLDTRQNNPYKARVTETRNQLLALSASVDEQEALLAKLDEDERCAAFWAGAFKRVRLFLVKRVLAALQVDVSNAARQLGIGGWGIVFATELETKAGTVRPGVHIHVSGPSGEDAAWEDLSGGEGQRVRLAVAMGLSSLIQRLAGVQFNIEIWDEPSAWLSPEGIENLLDCLHARALSTQRSIWLCDHRALLYSGFAEIWSVSKTDTGSQLMCLSGRE